MSDEPQTPVVPVEPVVVPEAVQETGIAQAPTEDLPSPSDISTRSATI